MNSDSGTMLRIEKKLDEILVLLTKIANTNMPTGALPASPQPLSAQNQICPLCKQTVVYREVTMPCGASVTGGSGSYIMIVRSCGCQVSNSQKQTWRPT